jgi:hypothetical protein
MKPPLSIGQEVEVLKQNPSKAVDKFVISWIRQMECDLEPMYSAHYMPWYPASSLRLVEEELKIGDWVEVIGETALGRMDCLEIVFKITKVSESENYSGDNVPFFPAASLRKLTPEEIQQHTGTLGFAIGKNREDLDRAQESLQQILAPLVDERLSEIEDDLDKIFERLQVLEGERPEVCDGGAIAGKARRKALLAGKTRVSITRGGIESFAYFDCPIEGKKWAKKALDDMRRG